MKLKDMYQIVVQEGMKVDPRGKAGVEAELKRIKDFYSEMPPWKKELFDEMKSLESGISSIMDTKTFTPTKISN